MQQKELRREERLKSDDGILTHVAHKWRDISQLRSWVGLINTLEEQLNADCPDSELEYIFE